MKRPTLYTVEEAVDHRLFEPELTSKWQVWRAIRDGKIDVIKRGSRYYITEKALEKYWRIFFKSINSR